MDSPKTNGTSDLSNNQRPCSRCHSSDLSTHVLRKELFCSPCLQSWVLSRLAKRVSDGFRVQGGGRDAVRRVLLPLSGGVSSLALLHLLDLHAAGRIERTGRCGYEVVVIWVDEQAITNEGFHEQIWEKTQERYSRWRIKSIPIHDVFSSSGPLSEQERTNLLSSLPVSTQNRNRQPQTLLSLLLTSLPEPSSRADLLSSLRTRLLTSLALRENCSIIIWGDTTTRLAEKTLASAAQGRGFSLPWQVSDGPTPFEGVRYMYPLQDLYRREIELWASTISYSEPLFGELIGDQQQKDTTRSKKSNTTASTKNQTIDDLMRNYFQGVEAQYPSLVANVVRTAGKLRAPGENNGLTIDCGICGLSFGKDTGDLLGWEGNQNNENIDDDGGGGGDDDDDAMAKADRKKLCYACLRTTEKVKIVDAAAAG